jgi:hypothetical protein
MLEGKIGASAIYMSRKRFGRKGEEEQKRVFAAFKH